MCILKGPLGPFLFSPFIYFLFLFQVVFTYSSFDIRVGLSLMAGSLKVLALLYV